MDLSKVFLNRQERKLLRKINLLTDQGQTRLVQIEKLTGEPEYNHYYFGQLQKFGLVGTHHYPEPDEDSHYRPDNGFCSTPDGLHYFDWHWGHLRRFMYRSFLVPIVVSIIANLIILLIEKF